MHIATQFTSPPVQLSINSLMTFSRYSNKLLMFMPLPDTSKSTSLMGARCSLIGARRSPYSRSVRSLFSTFRLMFSLIRSSTSISKLSVSFRSGKWLRDCCYSRSTRREMTLVIMYCDCTPLESLWRAGMLLFEVLFLVVLLLGVLLFGVFLLGVL